MDSLFNSMQENVENNLKVCENLYLMFDEISDVCGRYILSVLIGQCSEVERKKPQLIALVGLNKTNAENINSVILSKLNVYFDNVLDGVSRIELLLSDGAAYALKVSRMLKEINQTLKHVTWICHNLHNLCETISYKHHLLIQQLF